MEPPAPASSGRRFETTAPRGVVFTMRGTRARRSSPPHAPGPTPVRGSISGAPADKSRKPSCEHALHAHPDTGRFGDSGIRGHREPRIAEWRRIESQGRRQRVILARKPANDSPKKMLCRANSTYWTRGRASAFPRLHREGPRCDNRPSAGLIPVARCPVSTESESCGSSYGYRDPGIESNTRSLP